MRQKRIASGSFTEPDETICEARGSQTRSKLVFGAGALALLALLGGSSLRARRVTSSQLTPPPADTSILPTVGPTALLLPRPSAAAIAGRVVIDGADPPAQVCVQPAEMVIAGDLGGWNPNFGLHTRCVDAGTDGRYRIEDLPAGRHRVSASAPGFVAGIYRVTADQPWIVLQRGEQREGLDIHLQIRGVPVHGVVHDVAGGTISSALVSERDGARTHTDEDGQFTLWVYPGSSAYIGAIAPGYTADAAFARPPQPPLLLYLTPESVLRGRVIRLDTGAPLPGMPVHLQTDAIIDAETASDGSFEIRGLDPGRFKPFVRSAGWCGNLTAPIGIGIGETSGPITISAKPCRTVTAEVRVRPSGQPCPSAEIHVLDAVDDPIRRMVTDLSGQIVLNGLAAGAYKVKIRCPGYVQRAPEAWLLDEAMVSRITWEVEPGRTLRGKVEDHRGRPVPGAHVDAAGTWGFVSAETDAAGTFTLTALQPGPAQVTATHFSSGHNEPLELEVDETRDPSPVVLRLQTASLGRVRGQVRARVGALPPGLSVVVRALDSFAARSRPVSGDGSFIVEGLSPGRYRVTVQRAGGIVQDDAAGTLAESVAIGLEAKSEANVEFVLDIPPSAKLALQVEGPDGEAEPDALVTIRSSLLRHRGLTDEAGRFALVVPDLGDYTIDITARDGSTLQRKAAKPGETLVLRFPPTRRVCGRVGASEPVTGDFTVQVGKDRGESFSDTEQWCLERVPTGTHTFSARSPAFGVAQARVQVPAEGDISEVSLRFAGRSELRGTVVDAAGQPRVGVKIWVFDGAGRLVGGNLRSDLTGAFVLRNAPAGEVTIVPIPPGPMLAHDALLASGTKVQVSADTSTDPVVLTVP